MVSALAGVPTHLDKLDLSAHKDPEKIRQQVLTWMVQGGAGWCRARTSTGCAETGSKPCRWSRGRFRTRACLETCAPSRNICALLPCLQYKLFKQLMKRDAADYGHLVRHRAGAEGEAPGSAEAAAGGEAGEAASPGGEPDDGDDRTPNWWGAQGRCFCGKKHSWSAGGILTRARAAQMRQQGLCNVAPVTHHHSTPPLAGLRAWGALRQAALGAAGGVAQGVAEVAGAGAAPAGAAPRAAGAARGGARSGARRPPVKTRRKTRTWEAATKSTSHGPRAHASGCP